MKVLTDLSVLEIDGNFMVAATPVQKRNYVTLAFTKGEEKIVIELAKGVALAVRDEIRRVTGSR